MSIQSRRQGSRDVRENAADLAAARPHPRHRNNGEEQRYRRYVVVEDTCVDPRAKGKKKKERKAPECKIELSYIANFTKGLPHDTKTGLLLNPPDYRQFVRGIQSGDTADFEATPLGPAVAPKTCGCLSVSDITCESPPTCDTWESCIAECAEVRAWESQAAGLLFDLEGPDAQSVTMPPAPTLDSAELAAEMAEVYLMALLRDTHFSNYRDGKGKTQVAPKGMCEKCPPKIDVNDACEILQKLHWFNQDCCDLSDEERARHRDIASLTPDRIFRGIAPGDEVGPYLSQFLLIGNGGLDMGKVGLSDGYVNYGAIRIDQRVRIAAPCRDFMTTFESWVDVQNGAKVNGKETYEGDGKSPDSFRFMTTPRDLATYVHYDALYEAYLNACLILLSLGAPLDPGLPFLAPDVHDKQQGFASFGGPHILTLVTEVATRALKAVRYQKFNIHRRLRPEALAGLIDRYKSGIEVNGELAPLEPIVTALDACGLLELVAQHNACQNKCNDDCKKDASAKGKRYLLPMAFPEGSPMHPSYGAGHATVAGACVTILKAFFDHGWHLRSKSCKPIVYEPDMHGQKLVPVPGMVDPLTVEGELNKLGANIAIGRDWAGVHYFTDYIESFRIGEQIALGLLEEQRLCYGENFTMTVPLIDGSAIQI